MELFKKRYGKRMDHEERQRKKEARSVHEIAEKAQSLTKIKGKIFAKERYKEKVRMRKTIKAHEQKEATVKDEKEKSKNSTRDNPDPHRHTVWLRKGKGLHVNCHG